MSSSKALALNYGGQALDQQIVLIKKQNRRLKMEKAACIKVANVAMGLVAVMFAIAVIMVCVALGKVRALQSNVISLQSQITELTTTNESLVAENNQFRTEAESVAASYNEVSETLKSVSEVSTELDTENQTLIAANQSKDQIIATYEERSELFDKYEYTVLDDSGNRTDINYSDMKMLEDICEEKGLNQETVNLVLAIAMTESTGNEDAKSSISTARGFGQFLSGTGEFVYTELMGNSDYNHAEVASSGTENLEMMVYYLDYLNKNCDGNIGEVINRYRGLNDPSYKYKINRYLSSVGLSLAGVQIS